MKRRFFEILAFSLLSLMPSAAAMAETSFVNPPSQSEAVIVDSWGDAAEKIGGVSDTLTSAGQMATGFLQNLLLDWRNGGDLTLKVSETLEDLGLPAGRVLQASIVKGVGEAIEKIGKAIDYAIKGQKVVEAIVKGDKEAFKKAAADAIIDILSKTLGQAASKATFAVLTGTTVGWGAIPAWMVGELAGAGVEGGARWLLEKYGRETLENLLERAWNYFAGNSPGGGNSTDGPGGGNGGDPFGEEPEGPGGDSCNGGKFRGLKPLRLID